MNQTIDRRGVISALIAFTIWGLSPLFFKAMMHFGAFEVVAHRVLWSALLLAPWIWFRQGLGEAARVLREPRLLALLCLTALLATANWLVYVWAVMTGHAVDASLGYFINPLLNVALGAIFLHERLRTAQKVAVALAAIGVVWRIVSLGSLPWVALTLAITFAFYGLLRKRAPIDATNGLFIETLIALPVALVFLGWLASTGALVAAQVSPAWWPMLPLAGLITAVPLALFSEGARRLPLSVLGLLQYASPTLVFLIAVLVFREPFGASQLMSFAFIWAGLALFTWDIRRSRPPV
ncbi:EamA family transporter RarD [Uliginosibacterium sp. sgz301328]|uniref:EamA family transporter RarD n=1 Tax=Uliginosibacterium sp. sgz301328 TaxID=3243764 RepID=UPI00359D7F63